MTNDKTIKLLIRRQDGPKQPGYWQRFELPYEPQLNVITCLQRIAEWGRSAEGEKVPPVAWDCNCLEEVCGACSMVINGRVRQACAALIDRLMADGDTIRLEPMTKFPVLRDLVVDRSRMFDALKRVHAWVPVDGYYDLPTPRLTHNEQESLYPLSRCMTCGCCLEACPQFLKMELLKQPEETQEQFRARLREAVERSFMGAHAIAQVELFNSNPIGAMTAGERLDALIAEGGVQVCGNAQNCVKVCPKEIPLTTAIARAGRAATVHIVKKWLDR